MSASYRPVQFLAGLFSCVFGLFSEWTSGCRFDEELDFSDGSGVKPQKGTLHMLRKILMIALVLAAVVAPLATRTPGVDASESP